MTDNNPDDPIMDEKKTRRLAGRAARRRRRKIAAIRKQASDSMQIMMQQVTKSNTSFLVDVVPDQNSQRAMDRRSHIWPSVQSLREISPDDERILQSQLGYVPGNAIRVVARASQIYRDWFSSLSSSSSSLSAVAEPPPGWSNTDPVVLLLYPIVVRDEHLGGGKTSGRRRFKARKRIRRSNNTIFTTNDNDNDDNDKNKPEDAKNDNTEQQQLIEPFPTIYWLTHPLLHSLISKLEVEGFGIQCEQRIAASTHSLEQMHRAHTSYGHERWNILTDDDRSMIHSKQWETTAFAKRGVAGNRNYRAVKCLHAHAAHYLGTTSNRSSNRDDHDEGQNHNSDNIVGKWVMEEIQKRYYQQIQAK
jgi:hypothetical protein